MYDLIIIGAGPAGLACSIYASRFKINHLIIGQILGGTIIEAHLVENYPGFPSISGKELGQKFLEHAKSYGVEIVEREVIKIRKANPACLRLTAKPLAGNHKPPTSFEVVTADDETYQAKTLFLGLGTKVCHLKIPGEKEFLGRGVSYCASCDAPLFKDKIMAVVGGGNSAVTAALHLAEFAKKVFLIHKGGELSAEPIWQEKLFGNSKIEVIFNTDIAEIKGERTVSEIILDKKYQGKNNLVVDGVSVEIGTVPAIDLVKNLGVEMEKNLIKINPEGATSIKGIWAGGDVASALKGKEQRQVVNAASEGASAAIGIYKYLKTLSKKS